MLITAPYWFQVVSYKTRMRVASFSMGLACLLVDSGGLLHDKISDKARYRGKDGLSGIALELIGVSFISFQCSLGEPLDTLFYQMSIQQMETSGFMKNTQNIFMTAMMISQIAMWLKIVTDGIPNK
ncbi:hypothetical protein HJC23_003938 [Cyclotella cryptica]|uniref:Uncharacterized protein n=1 Tax=Cyclotella cryptica TaxID=29204 RepID=A0ABD3PV77_9STRA